MGIHIVKADRGSHLVNVGTRTQSLDWTLVIESQGRRKRRKVVARIGHYVGKEEEKMLRFRERESSVVPLALWNWEERIR